MFTSLLHALPFIVGIGVQLLVMGLRTMRDHLDGHLCIILGALLLAVLAVTLTFCVAYE